ncbi:DUF1501 domain-containing protein [Myxococcota bacterium]|nr:DUF1501 domain-containing protein [Myxococcota bacterium]
MGRSPIWLPSRRALLGASAASAAGLLLPGRARPAAIDERRFLFVFAEGGWDQACVFAPLFDNPLCDMESHAVPAQVKDIPFVDTEQRPSVRKFIERYASKTVFINGMESRSVAHDVCLRLMTTGTSLPAADDWPAILASGALADPVMPLLCLSGPSYTHEYGGVVVRAGKSGQLAQLVSGDALGERDVALSPPSSAVEALEDSLVAHLAGTNAALLARGREGELAQGRLTAERRAKRAGEVVSALSITSAGLTLSDDIEMLVEALAIGACRCASIGHKGFQGLTWDTHGVNANQSNNFEELFAALLLVANTLSERPGLTHDTLMEEVTVVVCSEMGRYPQLNTRGGKEHWTFTSCMMFGAGVRGGRAIGGYDDRVAGRRVDLESGDMTESGEALVPNHLGATLLALADMDPAEHVAVEPIWAALA